MIGLHRTDGAICMRESHHPCIDPPVTLLKIDPRLHNAGDGLPCSLAVQLGVQVHWAFSGVQQLVEVTAPISPPLDRPRFKPRGGFWTSSYTPDAEYGSDWERYCRTEWGDGLVERQPWLLYPKTARLIVIHTHDDLRDLVKEFPAPNPYDGRPEHPDWDAIQRAGYDGVHLTSFPENLYGWDSESTLWFRWCFTRVEASGDAREAHEH